MVAIILKLTFVDLFFDNIYTSNVIIMPVCDYYVIQGNLMFLQHRLQQVNILLLLAISCVEQDPPKGNKCVVANTQLLN